MKQELTNNKNFDEILEKINNSKLKVYSTINKEIINLYWNIGEYISKKIKSKEWGKKIVENLACYIKNKQPNLKGYSRQNLWRMKQFYETYKNSSILSALPRELENEIVPAILSQISWTNNIEIFSRCKTEEEREFYIKLAIKERLSSRELQRQINTSSFERVMVADKSLSPALKTIVKESNNNISAFKDTYILDFLDDLPKNHKEKDLQKKLIKGLKNFILEIGKDFSFVGENYKVEVGNSDFYIDLLFYHRELRCLVCFELKTEKFKPEHLGQLNFYLETLDRDIKKEHENESIGILLCNGKDDEVVKYAMNRSLTPQLVADYKIKLIPKKILQDKMMELLKEINN